MQFAATFVSGQRPSFVIRTALSISARIAGTMTPPNRPRRASICGQRRRPNERMDDLDDLHCDRYRARNSVRRPIGQDRHCNECDEQSQVTQTRRCREVGERAGVIPRKASTERPHQRPIPLATRCLVSSPTFPGAVVRPVRLHKEAAMPRNGWLRSLRAVAPARRRAPVPSRSQRRTQSRNKTLLQQ